MPYLTQARDIALGALADIRFLLYTAAIAVAPRNHGMTVPRKWLDNKCCPTLENRPWSSRAIPPS